MSLFTLGKWFRFKKERNYYNENNKDCKLYYYLSHNGYDYLTVVNPYDSIIFEQGLRDYYKIVSFSLLKSGCRDDLTDLKYKLLSSKVANLFPDNNDTPWLNRYFFYQYNLFSQKRISGQRDTHCPDICGITPDCKMINGVFKFASEIYTQLEAEIFEAGFHGLCRGVTYLKSGGNIDEEDLILQRDRLFHQSLGKTGRNSVSSARLKELLE